MAMPETRYAGGPDAYVGYQTVGAGPPDLVFIDHWLTNLDVMWESPVYVGFNNRLSSFARLILYDKRGTGVSDPPSHPQLVATVEDAVEDLAVVLDTVGAEKVAIVAHAIGGLVATQFAAAFPERVSSLVLGDSNPKLARDDTWKWGFSPRLLAQVAELVGTTYGVDGTTSFGVFAPSLLTDEAFCNWSARYARLSCSPGRMRKYWETVADIDVRSVLPLIQAPTMVIAHTASNIFARDMYEWVANAIPNARLVEVPTADHLLWAPQPDWLFDEIERFVTGHEPGLASYDVDRVLAAVVFTDIVGSTRELAAIGDRRFKAVLDVHDRTVASCAERFRGKVVRTTGDGALLTFDGPARALRFVLTLRQELGVCGIDIRAGVHAGEVEMRDNDLTGIAVHIGARVMEHSAPGQVVCSRTVKDLVAGSGLTFEDLGTRTLKGVPDDWQLFAVGAA
jgi:pimeloyl-ACP methyl ester carboxylesterase